MTTQQKKQLLQYYFNNEIEAENTIILETDTHYFIVIDTQILHSTFKFNMRQIADSVQHRANYINFCFAKIVKGLNFKNN
tara:strand:+ start:380 stop:619 length:240 start_codon:yes stop_codon:yes gene_type:complete